MKLPLMVLLSIKSKSYGRLHRTHYKQVIFMCKFWLSSKELLSGLLRGHKRGTHEMNEISYICVIQRFYRGPSLKSLSHLKKKKKNILLFPLSLFIKLSSSHRCCWELPCDGHSCYLLNPGSCTSAKDLTLHLHHTIKTQIQHLCVSNKKS